MFICLFAIKKNFCFWSSCKTFCPFWKSYWSSDLQLSAMPGLHHCIYIVFYAQNLLALSLPWSGSCLFTHCSLGTLMSWPLVYSYSKTLFGYLSINLKQTLPVCTSHCGTEMSINRDVLKWFYRVTKARIWACVWRWKAVELAHCACPLHRLLGENNFPKTCLMQPKKTMTQKQSCLFLISRDPIAASSTVFWTLVLLIKPFLLLHSPSSLQKAINYCIGI